MLSFDLKAFNTSKVKVLQKKKNPCIFFKILHVGMFWSDLFDGFWLHNQTTHNYHHILIQILLIA